MSRKIGEAGLKLIKNFEGCRLKAYKPVAAEKYWTIGWGHYGPDVKEGMTITQAQADEMLINDLAKYVEYVNNPAYVPVTAQLNQNQFDALVSFCYNCGNGNLRKLCTNRTIEQIAASIPKYTKGANGEVLKGLVRRREAELKLFNTDIKDGEDEVKREEYEALLARIEKLEKHVNISGNQEPPEWALEAIGAAKAAGAITTSNDKGIPEIKTIQMLYNLGMFKTK